jgi:NADPH:quinone reductase-like Zn-dependent oxidoreductase
LRHQKLSFAGGNARLRLRRDTHPYTTTIAAFFVDWPVTLKISGLPTRRAITRPGRQYTNPFHSAASRDALAAFQSLHVLRNTYPGRILWHPSYASQIRRRIATHGKNGGLGHLGIQFANKFGFTVAAVGRGPENAELAKKLGAHHYIDSKATNAAQALKKLGGASVILATAPSSKSMSEIFHGLGRNGTLLVVGADMTPIEIPGAALISGRKRIQGWASGTPSDSEDTMRFAALTGIRPSFKKIPLEKVAEAYARMTSGHAQFRIVLTM